jgi:hypothetical protein
VHLLTLVYEVLEPIVGGFDLAGHVGKFEADDGWSMSFLPNVRRLWAYFMDSS